MACEGASVVEGEQCPNEIDARNADNAKTRIAPRHLQNEGRGIMRVEFIIGYACAAAGAGLFLYVAACELLRSQRTQLAKVALTSLFLLVAGSCVAALANPPEGGPVQAIRSFFNMTQLATAPGMVMALLCAACAYLATTLHPGEGDLGIRCACAIGAVCACLLIARLAIDFAMGSMGT